VRKLLLAALVPLAVSASAQSLPAKLRSNDLSTRPFAAQFRVAFTLKIGGLDYASSFVLQDGSQANYIDGGEVSYVFKGEKGESIEFKKRGVIVNCVAVENPNAKSRVRAECQFEISGPVKSATRAADVATFQLQTSFEAEKGKPLLVVDGPDKRVEVTITEIK
jgi:hypothetical protein